MAKYGTEKFGTFKYGLGGGSKAPENASIDGIWLGFAVHKQFGHEWIFQVCPGNGYYGTRLGHLYQKKYAYIVPTSINNIEGQPARDAMAEAVLNWQTVLTTEEKTAYNRKAAKQGGLSGYNLYIGEYIEANA